jgi:hypothetical protein
MALALVSVIIGMGTAPALGRDDRREIQQERRGDGGRDRPDERSRREERGRHEERMRPEYRTYDYYPAPVYAPPPVVYAPVPSPGISIFFPLEFRFH